MTDTISVHPGRLSQFGSPQGATFCLVTNPAYADAIEVVHDAPYDDFRTVFFDHGDVFENILATLPEPSHVLAISPDRFFESPDSSLLGNRKMMAMACNSTPTTFDIIKHFIGVMERTSATEQDKFADMFFERAEAADALEYVNERTGTRAVLDHLQEDLVWNQQAGSLDWGEQQIVPSGEISVLPIEIREFHEDLRLPLEGEITIRGYPILHNGTPSFTRGDQARIHRELIGMTKHAIRCRLENGAITTLTAVDPGAQQAVDMLEAMFTVDSRYRIVWEIGHALNTSLDLLPGNHAMNEVYGGTQGCLHWGLGLTPYTQFHLDIISPDTCVIGQNTGEVLLGTPGQTPVERVAAA
jgi:hypothetical protein